jgi:hypothetical protein
MKVLSETGQFALSKDDYNQFPIASLRRARLPPPPLNYVLDTLTRKVLLNSQ